MDDIDRAQQRQADDTALAIYEHRAKAEETVGVQTLDDEGRVICEACGDTLSAARLAAQPKATHCVACLGDIERRDRRWRA
jgi:RNA polymerase-binding transcription factor DksA